MTEIRKMIPNILSCDPPGDNNQWECIFFKVPFNAFREVSGSHANEVTDREEMKECEGVIALPANYSENVEPVPLVISCHGAGGTVCEAENRTGGVAYSCGSVIPAVFRPHRPSGFTVHSLRAGSMSIGRARLYPYSGMKVLLFFVAPPHRR